MKISIITVCYNSSSTIEDTIVSVLSQNYASIEYIVVDGQSTDDTLKILQKYQGSISKIISEKDEGMYDALNKGILQSTGDVIGILNADDVFENADVLKNVVQAFKTSNAEIVYGDIKYVSKSDVKQTIRYWKAGNYTKGRFLYGWMPPHTGFFIKRDAYLQYGMYRLDVGTAADYELMLRMMHVNELSAHYIPMVTTLMRVGGISNNSIKSRWTANRNDLKAWKVNNVKPMLFTLLLKPLSKLPQYFLK